MQTWAATDATGAVHTYTGSPFTVGEALGLYEAYRAYKAASMTIGAVVGDSSWMPRILWGVPGRAAMRDGVLLDAGVAEFAYGNGNLIELRRAAEERAKAAGFFDTWMREITSRAPAAAPAEGSPSPSPSA